MSTNSLALTSSRNWRAGSEYGASPPDHEHHQNRHSAVPWPLYYRPEEGGGMHAPWRLFEERVRTGPYGLTRFPLQPYSPIRILVLDGITNERVNPRLRQFISDSPQRIRGEWHLGLPPEPEDPALTDEEFKKAMKKLRKQVYNPPYPRRRAWKISLFSSSKSSSSNNTAKDAADEEEKEEGKQCTICLEAFMPNERVLVTPCNHMFHNDCLVPWVRGHGQCPVCRFILCERRERALPLNNNRYTHMASMGEDELPVDLIFLVRAMEEAFNWVHLSR